MNASELYEKLTDVAQKFSGLIFRVLAFGVSSVFFSVYPIYIFLVYMAANGFYAYEMPENFFSLRVFFLTTLITLAMVGAILLYPLPGVIRCYQKDSEPTWYKKLGKAIWENVWLIIGNAFIWVLLIALALNAKDDAFLIGVVVSFLLGLLFLLIFFAHGRTYFIALVVYVGVAFFHPLFDQRPASSLLEIGLRKFNVGGVDVELDIDGKKAPGHLLFLSPNYIYIRHDAEHKVAIVPRTDSVTLSYDIKSPEAKGSNPAVQGTLRDEAAQRP